MTTLNPMPVAMMMQPTNLDPLIFGRPNAIFI